MSCTAAEIMAATGGHCPAHDDRKASLSVYIRNNQVRVHCHAGCSQLAVKAALERRGIVVSSTRLARHDTSNADRIRHASGLWEQSIPFAGTLVDDYLYRRWIDLSPSPSAIRFLPHARAGWRQPAMIAALRDNEARLTAVQLTYLNGDGSKASHLKLVRQNYGCMEKNAVRLASTVRDTLGLAEGVETALSAAELYRVPTWATLNAARLKSIQIPQGVRLIILFADNDEPGLRAAQCAGQYYQACGFNVTIRAPERFKDFNDLLRHEKRHAP